MDLLAHDGVRVGKEVPDRPAINHHEALQHAVVSDLNTLQSQHKAMEAFRQFDYAITLSRGWGKRLRQVVIDALAKRDRISSATIPCRSLDVWKS
jgi:hypothetical protein